jgi:pheromone shutdown protein TraB
VPQRDLGRIACLLDGAPENPPLSKAKGTLIALIPVNLHQPNEADLSVINKGKHTSETAAVHLFGVLIVATSS